MAGASPNGQSQSVSTASVEELWQAYAAKRSPELREQLIMHYAWLVKHVLGRLAIVLPPSLDYNDLLGHGTIALVEAVDKFEPERGNKFETYAVMKIRGAILDAVRAMDFVSRPIRHRMKQVTEVIASLTREYGRQPTDEEVAAALGIGVSALLRLYQRGAATVISLDAIPMLEVGDEDVVLHEACADAAQLDPAEEAVRSELADMLAAVIGDLPERDQLVLSLYYHDGLNMREVGQVLGISESRVCQIHGRALAYLRAQLSRHDPELAESLRSSSARLLAGVTV
jgi:RNA polymerase sigma factor for flagellar operon FliA